MPIRSPSNTEAIANSHSEIGLGKKGCEELACQIRTFVGVVGVSDLIVVATGDAVLVAPKSRAQDVKKIIDDLKARGREDLL